MTTLHKKIETMAAKLSLDRFQLLWYLEGAARGSHLRWDIYPIFVNDVFPQLNESERECIYTYAKRDLSSIFSVKYADDTAKSYFQQMLARYNPANQYKVSVAKDCVKKVVQAYMWNGEYYVNWARRCAREYIKKVEHLPYRKCRNIACEMRESCLRYTDYQEGDKVMDGPEVWGCKNCDLIIEKDYGELYNM
jgi:hypothetical protein